MSVQNSQGIYFQSRDLAILRELFESRLATAAHIAALHFNGSKEAAKKRLQKLKAAGLITARRRALCEPAALSLTRAGFGVLKERGILAEYPPLTAAALDKRARVSDLTVRHELTVMDVKAAFHSALRAHDRFSVAEFSTWPLLYQFKAYRGGHTGAEVVVKPDGFIRIQEGRHSEYYFFLEVDCSTEVQDTLAARASCYIDYYKSGGFALRNGGTRAEYKEYPFRVLMVFQTAERRNIVAERLLQSPIPIYTQVLLSTLAEATADPLGAIWMRPLDYRDATDGTRFDVSRTRETWGYRRQTEREILVDRQAKRVRLLEDEPAPDQSGSPA